MYKTEVCPHSIRDALFCYRYIDYMTYAELWFSWQSLKKTTYQVGLEPTKTFPITIVLRLVLRRHFGYWYLYRKSRIRTLMTGFGDRDLSR